LLEGGGLVGLIAFVLLMYLAVHDTPLAPRLANRLRARPSFATYYDLHILLFAECVGFVVLVQFDNTLFAAGNLISALAWMCAAASGTLSTYCRLEHQLHSRRPPVCIHPWPGGAAFSGVPTYWK